MKCGVMKDDQIKKLGKRIKELRKQKGLTQFDLASFINKDQQALQRIETGKVNPSYYYLVLLCRGLDITMEDMF